MYWFMALGIGPLVGAPVGAAVGRKTDNIYYGVTAGVAASYLTNTITIGGVLQRTWAASNFIRFGSSTATVGLGQAAAAGAYGYALGSTVGTGLSWLLFGEEGRDAAIKLYTSPLTGEVTLAEWAEAVTSIPSLVAENSAARRSTGIVPADNAAGLPGGTTEWEVQNPDSPFNPFTGEPNRAYVGG